MVDEVDGLVIHFGLSYSNEIWGATGMDVSEGRESGWREAGVMNGSREMSVGEEREGVCIDSPDA